MIPWREVDGQLVGLTALTTIQREGDGPACPPARAVVVQSGVLDEVHTSSEVVLRLTDQALQTRACEGRLALK